MCFVGCSNVFAPGARPPSRGPCTFVKVSPWPFHENLGGGTCGCALCHRGTHTCSGVVFAPPAAGELGSGLRSGPPHPRHTPHTRDPPNPVSKSRLQMNKNVKMMVCALQPEASEPGGALTIISPSRRGQRLQQLSRRERSGKPHGIRSLPPNAPGGLIN